MAKKKPEYEQVSEEVVEEIIPVLKDATRDGVRSGTVRPGGRRCPREYEALLVMIADEGFGSRTLTMAELDAHRRTQHLSLNEKKILLRYAPKFFEDIDKAKEIEKLRTAELEYALSTEAKAKAIAKREGMDKMTLAGQLTSTTHEFHKQVYKASLSLVATDIEQLHTDPMSRELYKLRVGYVKDFIWIARQLGDLSERIHDASHSDPHLSSLTDEAKEQLAAADALLLSRGININGSN